MVRIAPFEFRVKRTRGADNLVTDTLSRMCTKYGNEDVVVLCNALLESLTLKYTSVEELQKEDEFCKKIQEEIQQKRASTGLFKFTESCCASTPKGLREVGE